MIDALIKGDKPTATIEKFSSDHPSNITKNHKESIAEPLDAIKTSISTKGTGITTNNLYNASNHTVHKSFC
jgi:hypothetical protein